MVAPDHHPAWGGQLESGLWELGIRLEPAQRETLLDYLALLRKWNRTYNLTAIREPLEMVPRQLLDSLSILHLLHGERVLDVGTGPGLPGIPLAIAEPRRRFVLLDANGKKSRFVQQVIYQLGLENTAMVQGRVEAFRPKALFDTIVSRAFAPLPRMADLAGHLLAADGLLLAMKGVLPVAELEQLRRQGFSVESERLRVPGSDGERHAILCRRG